MPSRSRITKAAVVLHGRPEALGSGVERLESVAREEGVELSVVAGDGQPAATGGVGVAIVLGGDGTMLRALQGFLGTGVPVVGVNFGRVGFLSSIARDELEQGVRRVFAGELEVVELPTLEVEVDGKRFVAVNDAVVTSGALGRMIELEWSIGGQNFGRVPCDGLICSTPSGSTAYNLSNGGPVLMWGLDAMALTFVAPHDLRARPFVVPRGHRPRGLEPNGRRRLRRARRRPSPRRRGSRGAGVDQARRGAVAARDAAGCDLRPPLPPELRPRLTRSSGTWRRRPRVRHVPAGLPSARCCAASGSRTSSSSVRRSSSSEPG